MSQPSRKSLTAATWNVELLAATGCACFWTFTFWSQQCYKILSKQFARFQEQLVHKHGAYGFRVWEAHEEAGLHVHAVMVANVEYMPNPMGATYGSYSEQIEECGRDTLVGIYHCAGRVSPNFQYPVKRIKAECVKQFQDDQWTINARRWGTFGNFPDRQRVRDIYVTGPEAECYREALALREPGESIGTVEATATHLFLDYLKSEAPQQTRRLVEGEGGEKEYEYDDEFCRAFESGSGVTRSETDSDGPGF
jgi:hypothetical protein